MTLIPYIKSGLLVGGIVLAVFLCVFIAELLEQADIGRDIDDSEGGK